jgi:glycosyltransferase involved in cell wall biosynthesis
MRIIILTQYFPPEVGAPQNRLYEVAVRLAKKGVEVEVLTAMPNYPKMQIDPAYKGKWYVNEKMDGLNVHRSWVWVGKSKSIMSRLLNYFSFVFSSMWIGLFKLSKADYIFCESPPLFLGVSAIFLKKTKRAKLIFNVADLWPESAEKLGIITNKFLLRVSTRLEEYLYKSSALITGQAQGIVKNIQDRFPAKTVYWLRNGVDLSYYDYEKVQSKWREENGFTANDFIVLYAGIIGYAQALELILKAGKATEEHPEMKWILLGSGPEKEKLLQMKAEMKLNNVFFYDPVTKKEMPQVWKACDLAVVPLRRLDLFKGIIPSKLFEAMAMKKPLLLGVEGEAEDLFIKEGKAGLAFTPEDAADLANKALYLYKNKQETSTLGENGYNYVRSKFNRDIIAENFYDFLSSNLSAPKQA